MPAPYPEVVRALGQPRSPIAFAALPGAAVGIGCGLALTILTSLSWGLVTGGKPILSVPPFLIITFELAILVGSLANLTGLLLGGWRGGRAAIFPTGATFNGDRVGVYSAGQDLAVAARILRACGAEEVTHVP
jgi:molybdopterin-containing oxidoreductase family membrane subunit